MKRKNFALLLKIGRKAAAAEKNLEQQRGKLAREFYQSALFNEKAAQLRDERLLADLLKNLELPQDLNKNIMQLPLLLRVRLLADYKITRPEGEDFKRLALEAQLCSLIERVHYSFNPEKRKLLENWASLGLDWLIFRSQNYDALLGEKAFVTALRQTVEDELQTENLCSEQEVPFRVYAFIEGCWSRWLRNEILFDQLRPRRFFSDKYRHDICVDFRRYGKKLNYGIEGSLLTHNQKMNRRVAILLETYNPFGSWDKC